MHENLKLKNLLHCGMTAIQQGGCIEYVQADESGGQGPNWVDFVNNKDALESSKQRDHAMACCIWGRVHWWRCRWRTDWAMMQVEERHWGYIAQLRYWTVLRAEEVNMRQTWDICGREASRTLEWPKWGKTMSSQGHWEFLKWWRRAFIGEGEPGRQGCSLYRTKEIQFGFFLFFSFAQACSIFCFLLLAYTT